MNIQKQEGFSLFSFLPQEIKKEIFSCLDQETNNKCMRVSKEWKQFLESDFIQKKILPADVCKLLNCVSDIIEMLEICLEKEEHHEKKLEIKTALEQSSTILSKIHTLKRFFSKEQASKMMQQVCSRYLEKITEVKNMDRNVDQKESSRVFGFVHVLLKIGVDIEQEIPFRDGEISLLSVIAIFAPSLWANTYLQIFISYGASMSQSDALVTKKALDELENKGINLKDKEIYELLKTRISKILEYFVQEKLSSIKIQKYENYNEIRLSIHKYIEPYLEKIGIEDMQIEIMIRKIYRYWMKYLGIHITNQIIKQFLPKL